jgi:hypothetical protein
VIGNGEQTLKSTLGCGYCTSVTVSKLIWSSVERRNSQSICRYADGTQGRKKVPGISGDWFLPEMSKKIFKEGLNIVEAHTLVTMMLRTTISIIVENIHQEPTREGVQRYVYVDEVAPTYSLPFLKKL